MEGSLLTFGFLCHSTDGIEDFFDLQGPLVFHMVMVMKRGRNGEVQEHKAASQHLDYVPGGGP